MKTKTDGSLWVWGKRPDVEPVYNDDGMVSCFETTPVKMMDSVKDVETELNSFAVLTIDGQVQTWGSLKDLNVAFEESREAQIKDIEISNQALFVIKEDGSLWAIGDNQNWTFGLQGIGTKNGDGIDIIEIPVQLTGIKKTNSNENSTQTTSLEATPTTSKVLVNGKEISFDAYSINDNNYFKLRDLGQTFDFGVGWDGAANTVTIDTSTGHTAES